MLETAYLIGKILVSTVFLLLSVIFVSLSFKAGHIKAELLAAETKIKKELSKAHNMAAVLTTVIISILFTGVGAKDPLWLKVLSFTGLAKYASFFKPLRTIFCSFKEISTKFTGLGK